MALRNAVVIIDEPQIMDVTVWNAFLSTWNAACQQLGAQSIIMSATVPPTTYAACSVPPVQIQAPPMPVSLARYRLTTAEHPWTTNELIDTCLDLLTRPDTQNVAVLMNTITDVARVYQDLQALNPGFPVYALHGAMHELHKAYTLSVIKDLAERNQPFCVVATQTLEAGVNVSFSHMLRARAILPSIIQAAGRVNRHGTAMGQIIVFDYIREDGRDSRTMVYRDPIMREETDRRLVPGTEVDESLISLLSNDYYQSIFERNHYSAVLDQMRGAANGQWSHVAGLEPYAGVHDRYPLFCPVTGDSNDSTRWIDSRTAELLAAFAVTPETLYDKLTEKQFVRALSFSERKRFLSLFERFTTSVPYRVGRAVSEMSGQRAVQCLSDVTSYSPGLGLAHWFLRENLEESVIW